MSPLNIFVCVKQVLETRLALGIEEKSVVQKEPWPVYVMNPADRCALDEAIRLRDEAGGGCVTAVTLGVSRTGSVLAQCLARGADKAIHVLTDKSAQVDSFSVARVLSEVIRQRKFDLILCGSKTEDDGASEVGAVMAELLDIALVSNAVNLCLSFKEDTLTAVRKLERGYRQELQAGLPALVTVDTSICQPRYVTVRARRNRTRRLARDAERISMEDHSMFSYGSDLRCVLDICPPRPRPKKIVRPKAAPGVDPLAALMGIGGPAPKKPAETNKDSGPESLADEIIDFIKEKGFLM